MANKTKSFQEQIQSNFELRAMLAMEKKNQRKETMLMHIEDVRSSLPPLTKPAPLQVVKHNHRAVWLRWKAFVYLSPISLNDNLYV